MQSRRFVVSKVQEEAKKAIKEQEKLVSCFILSDFSNIATELWGRWGARRFFSSAGGVLICKQLLREDTLVLCHLPSMMDYKLVKEGHGRDQW